MRRLQQILALFFGISAILLAVYLYDVVLHIGVGQYVAAGMGGFVGFFVGSRMMSLFSGEEEDRELIKRQIKLLEEIRDKLVK